MRKEIKTKLPFSLQEIGLIFIITLGSCASMRNSHMGSYLADSNCSQQKDYRYTTQDMPAPIHTLVLDTVLSRHFSFRSLNVAHAIGILNKLELFIQNRQGDTMPGLDYRLKELELAQSIHQGINTASLEVSAIASEMDCEEERAGQVADYLGNKESDAETRLTTAAIITGAAGAIASGIILANGSDGNGDQVIGIGTGIAEATLALVILLNKKKVTFYHPRNALKEIWQGNSTSAIFPAGIWYYLNYDNPARPELTSLRYQIIDKWMSFGQISDSKKKRQLIDLYFGDGGRYTTSQLNNRANMLDQLEAYINLMKQDLKELATEFELLKSAR